MSTKRTDVGSMVLVQTVAGFHGKPAKTYGGVLVHGEDGAAVTAEVMRQIAAVRKLKGVRNDQTESVD